MLQRIRDLKKSRRGFTLVEIIVVLVILAILAAFTIPAMLGFVNDARSKAYVAEAREVKVAYQSAVTQVVAETAGSTQTIADTGTDYYTNADSEATPTDVKPKVQRQAMLLLNGDLTEAGTTAGTYKAKSDSGNWNVTVLNGTVTKVEYTKGGYKITIEGTTTKTEKAS